MGVLILLVLVSFVWWSYYHYDVEAYLVISFSILSVIGLVGHFSLYYFHDNSSSITFTNILFFLPLFYLMLKRIKQIKLKLSYIMLGIFYIFVILQFFNFYNFNILAKIYDLATYSVLFIFVLLPYFYQFDYEKYIRKIYSIFFPVFVFIAFYGISQYILGPNSMDAYWMETSDFAILGQPYPFLIKPFATTASPGHYAAVSFFAFLMSIVLITNHKKNDFRMSKFFLIFILFLSLLSTVITGVRSVLVLEILIFVGYFLVYKKGVLKFTNLIAMGLFTIIVIYMMSELDFSNLYARLETFNNVNSGDDVSLNARVETALTVIKKIFEDPFGYGLGSSGKFSTGEFTNIDNGYLELIYELGFLATIFFILYIIIAFIRAFLKKPKSSFLIINRELALLSSFFIIAIMFIGNFLQIFIAWYIMLFISLNQVKRRTL